MRKKPATPTSSPKPNLLIVASLGARSSLESPLLRLVRDNADVLKMFSIHTTKGTGGKLYGTGYFERDEITLHRAGQDGGIAQLVAMVARRECIAVIMLLDPRDPLCDAVENRALKRVCIQLEILLVTTYDAAKRWLTKEVAEYLINKYTSEKKRSAWKPGNWRKGNKNVKNGEAINLPIDKRTLALISHDGKKYEMIQFVKKNVALLAQHQRILTTGTTGWLLKLLMVEGAKEKTLLREVHALELEKRLKEVLITISKKDQQEMDQPLEKLLGELRKLKEITPNNAFVDKVMPLPSGPEGGDALVADAILNAECHSIVFLHDPTAAHPHSADIRLLENTSQLPRTFSECVSDVTSANGWVQRLKLELDLEKKNVRTPDHANELRRAFGLYDVVLVSSGSSDKDGDSLGTALARVCAGYFNQRLIDIARHAADGDGFSRRRGDKKICIGISWGWGASQVLKEIENLNHEELLEKPQGLPQNLIWTPLIGTIMSESTDREAGIIAQRFSDFYGGEATGFPYPGFAQSRSSRPLVVDTIVQDLAEAKIILTTASPWDEESSLYRRTGLDHSHFPSTDKAVGLLSGVFLNAEGKEEVGEYSIVGLGFKGFKKAAKRGAVILMCGGRKRVPIIRAALKAQLVSTLVTTTETCKKLLADRDL